MAYRVQNHSLDILVPGKDNAGDALLIDVDSNATPTYTYASIRSTSAPEFVRCDNGLVEIKFSSLQPKSDNVFPTGIHMITLTDQEPAQEVKHIWYEKGDPTVGLLGEPSGKFDYYVLYPKAKPSQPLSPSQPPYPHKPPSTITSPPPLKLSPYNQKALSIIHQDSPRKDKEVILSPVFPITKDLSCSYSQEYEQEIPSLIAFEHLDSRTKHDWKIKKPNDYHSNWACKQNQSR
nr:putative zinc finger, CCHC-type [Tanacetum cinerariifolium]